MTPKQAVGFFGSSVSFAQWMCEELASSTQIWQCCCMQQPQCGAGLCSRLPACKKTNTGNPFFLVSTQLEDASMRVTMRNFCVPLSPLGNAVPITKVEERS